MRGVLLVLVCSGRGHVMCVYGDMKARQEGGINEVGSWLLLRDTQSSHCRPYRPLFVLQGHNAVNGFVGTRAHWWAKEGKRGGDIEVYGPLYTLDRGILFDGRCCIRICSSCSP
jgi:hypothetical protein